MIPHITNIFFVSFIYVEKFSYLVAYTSALCDAAPSRPAEPPNACVNIVPANIRGVIFSGISLPDCTDS